MRVCNRCGRDETEVKMQSKTLRCKPCSKEIWEENKRLAGEDPNKVRRDAKTTKKYSHDALAFYVESFREQEGKCKICGREEWKQRNGRTMNLCIDHCHDTEKLRGLLCHQCNSAIGFLNDDPALVAKALGYLLTHTPEGIPDALQAALEQVVPRTARATLPAP